jgi:hypothetical protein
MNRAAISMVAGDQAVVFKLKTRLEEGRILSTEELEALPYELGLLTKLE